MQTGEGLTPFALMFMLVSMGAVTALMLWCFYRILRTPPAGTPPAGSSGAGTEGGASTAPGEARA